MPYTPTGKPMGRPKKIVEVTPETVIVAMAEKQCPKTEIAALLNISIDTFDRRYAELYATARLGGKAKLREKLFAVAMSGNVQLLMFLGKSVLGLKETSVVELPPISADLSQLNDDDLQQLERLRGKVDAQPGTDPGRESQAPPA